jgi:CheY-like chemotaxis protein
MALFRRLLGALQGTAGLSSEDDNTACWLEVSVVPGQGPALNPQTGATGDGLMLREGVRILIADDDEVNRTVLSRMAERTGAAVDVVRDGLEAVHALERTPYDLVLMDHYMPGLDGIEATRRIRAAEATRGRRAVIVGVTATVLDEDRRLCEVAGMDEFLSKPVSVRALHAVLRRWLARAA